MLNRLIVIDNSSTNPQINKEMISSIIDVPRQHDQNDLFGINVYQDALIDFVKHTDTPITIALQGEWGSGKTSLMNQLRWNLCDADGAPYFPVWINTWQYSLMKSPNESVISILEGIINQIGALNPDGQKWAKSKKKIGSLFKKMAKVGVKVAASQIGVDGGDVDDMFGSEESSQSDISQLKTEIADLIGDALKHNPNKVGFTFYIDDLDRIDPPVAVDILELLKNIFDLKHCVFILAIDYDVVIKGLKPKFGELTDKNEREFRSFFDKIIQLPFSMPVASYNIDTFLVDALKKIEFFTTDELSNLDISATLSEIARLSVGCNPRSLKRLTNTLSLISIINRRLAAGSAETAAGHNKVLNFALVCMQIAYPYIYNQVTEEPDFKKWDDATASRLKLRPLSNEERASLEATEEFDEDWERVVFRMCQKETYLSNRAFQVSGLLNKIAEIVNSDDKLGNIVAATIEMSAVTNLKAFDSPNHSKSYSRKTYTDSFGDDIAQQADLWLKAVNDATGGSYELNYNAGYVGLLKNGKPRNFVWLSPKKKENTVKIGFARSPFVPEIAEIMRLVPGITDVVEDGWCNGTVKPDFTDFAALAECFRKAESTFRKKKNTD